jgi:hypothetical protein
MFSRNYGNGLYGSLSRLKFPFKVARSGNEASDWLATEFPLKEQIKTEFDTRNR